MSMHDDIPGLDPASDSAPGSADNPRREQRVVGAESEARGGSEAPEDSIDNRPSPDVAPNTGLGSSAALPEGSLPGPYLKPQSDENRQPPANAPAPVNPTATVKNIRPDTGKKQVR